MMMMRSNSKSVFSLFFFFFFVQNIYTSSVIPVNVGVIFDFDDWVGKMWWSCINMSLSDFYTTHSHYKTRLELHPRDSIRDVLGAAAAGEKVISNLARIVVITWCFVGLVLTQSYAAALSSFLTVQQLNSNAYDLNELIQKRQHVGYQSGSSVRGFLKSLGFYESQLLPYSSAEECDQLLSKGNENGGIAVAIDEAPYLNIILAEHCDKYTMAESMDLQKYMTSGFGFVFSRGSSLVPDVSRAILALRENGEIKKLEDEWFDNGSCSVRSDPVSNRLGLDSFKGLFLIAGMISVLALLIYMVMIVYENRQVLINPRISMLSRILDLLTIFQKHFSLASRKRGFNSPAGTSAPGLAAPNHTVQEHPRGEQGVH